MHKYLGTDYNRNTSFQLQKKIKKKPKHVFLDLKEGAECDKAKSDKMNQRGGIHNRTYNTNGPDLQDVAGPLDLPSGITTSLIQYFITVLYIICQEAKKTHYDNYD